MLNLQFLLVSEQKFCRTNAIFKNSVLSYSDMHDEQRKLKRRVSFLLKGLIRQIKTLNV